MSEEFRKEILKGIPTKVLLRAYVPYNNKRGMGWYGYTIDIMMGKFANWNPYKGHNAFTQIQR